MATNRLTRRQFVVALTLPALLRTSGLGHRPGEPPHPGDGRAGQCISFRARRRSGGRERVPVDLDIRQTNGSNENAELVNAGKFRSRRSISARLRRLERKGRSPEEHSGTYGR